MRSVLPAVLLLAAWVFSISADTDKSNLPTTESELGRMLFFDPILSANRSTSCASCHKPEFAFADSTSFSKGFNGGFTSRNTPTVMNMSSRPYLFWDGRSPNLEDQAIHPIVNPVEMGLKKTDIVKRLKSSPFYKKAFQKIYGSAPDLKLLGKAIAAFERTLETADSPFDKYMEGDSTAISASAIRGRELFLEKGHCFDCHFTPDFTADEFRNIGLFNGKNLNDSGRYLVSQNPEDIGRFKVPGLRNVALTAPYMHNGQFRTLRQVVDYYDNPDAFIPNSIGRDTILAKPLGLNEQEKEDLVEFMKSLTSTISR